VARTCKLADPHVSFSVLDPFELAAGKVKALMERVAARDLYDIARLGERLPSLLEDPLARALAMRAISSSEPFPALADPVKALARFDDPQASGVEALRSVLAADDEPDFAAMRNRVAPLLAPLSRPTSNESEYLRLLGQEARDRPELLFAPWPDVLERARRDPVMQWKVVNLRKRPPDQRQLTFPPPPA
jgi:hypothetical protein